MASNVEQSPSPTTEPPQEINNQFSRLNNFLRHKTSRKFLKYEFEYTDCENEFFNKTETFKHSVSHHFSKLKTRNLTMVEWRKIRQMISNGKCRRFSSNFIKEKRVALQRHQRRFNVLQESNKTAESLVNISPTDELSRLIVELKRALQLKQNAVNELGQINKTKNEMPNTDTSSDATKVLDDLQRFNKLILECFEKMESFKSVKDAQLIDNVANGAISFQFSPKYFQLMCQVRAHDSLSEYNFESLTGSDDLIELMKIVLEMILNVIERDLLATDVVQFFDDSSDSHLTSFQIMLSKENTEYVETVCLPAMFQMLKKLPFERAQPIE